MTPTVIVLVCAAVVVGAVVGITRYGGWKRWTGDIRAGLRAQRDAGFLVLAVGYAAPLCAIAAVGVCAIFMLSDVLQWSNLGQRTWGDPVWESEVVFPVAAALFLLAGVGMGCVVRLWQLHDRSIPHAATLVRIVATIPFFGLAAIVGMVWRVIAEQAPPLLLLYLLPIVATTLASLVGLLLLLRATQSDASPSASE